ncbi:hypothetical protein GJU40_16205 [Bacillus lacus]|uniref:Uncharacterized protein n=1 Tax=Metabacillus lacus TaxID=1983721 RepID=A0A7X2LYL0_9BACI|nr:hypothetical protein [Metabacillus lacus]
MYRKRTSFLFIIGVVSMIVGVPYLLGYSTNKLLNIPLYGGLLLAILFSPTPNLKNLFNKKKEE